MTARKAGSAFCRLIAESEKEGIMNKERINRLKELAEKATPGPWWFGGLFSFYADDTALGTVQQFCDGRYITAANPQAILELIAELERLEKENERWRIEVHDLDSSGREAAQDMQALEKEADWLAKRLAEFCDPDHDDQCCVLCRESCNGVDGKEWREAARKAMEASNA